MSASWNRVNDRAQLGVHSTTSDRRGYHYLSSYQGNIFFQAGLAIPAGNYTLTFEHAAAATDHTIQTWQLVNSNNVAHTANALKAESSPFGPLNRF